jgi:hypothetical protein
MTMLKLDKESEFFTDHHRRTWKEMEPFDWKIEIIQIYFDSNVKIKNQIMANYGWHQNRKKQKI